MKHSNLHDNQQIGCAQFSSIINMNFILNTSCACHLIIRLVHLKLLSTCNIKRYPDTFVLFDWIGQIHLSLDVNDYGGCQSNGTRLNWKYCENKSEPIKSNIIYEITWIDKESYACNKPNSSIGMTGISYVLNSTKSNITNVE